MNDIINMLDASIKDESDAVAAYSNILKVIDIQYADSIADILEDEIKHFFTLKDIRDKLSQTLTLQPAPGWPALPIPRVPFGHMVVNTMPDGAEIYLDGQPVLDSVGNVATTPASVLDIAVGIHRVTFRKFGYFDENVDVFIENGLYSDVSAVLRPKIEVTNQLNLQPKQFGLVYFDTQPHGARIYVDGQLLIDPDTEESLKTPARYNLYEGRHDFTFVLEGHEDASGYVDVFPGVTVNIYRNMKPGKGEEGWGEPQPQIWLE